MADYTFDDAVRDRDEAYRLLAHTQARLDAADARFDDAELVYSVQYQSINGRWHCWGYENHSYRYAVDYLLPEARQDEFDQSVKYRLAAQLRAPWVEVVGPLEE